MRRSPLQEYARLVPYPVRRKLLSLLDGYHHGEGAGSSHEFLDMTEYRVGDDIAAIDWKGTARLGHPLVKRFESTAVLRVVVVVDTGSNMAAAASDQTPKKEIALELLRALAWLVASHGDLLGLVAGNESGQRRMPARSGASHAETLLRVAASASVTGSAPDLPGLLRLLDAPGPRSLVFVISDVATITPAVIARLRRLSVRNTVGLFLIEDFDPAGAAPVAEFAVEDVQGGLLPSFVQGNPELESQWRGYLRSQSQAVDAALGALNLRYARVGSAEQILPALVEVVGGVRRGS